ncbi:MAG: hypothetical protein AB7G06_09650 [Bdellovibrionales bacterium]
MVIALTLGSIAGAYMYARSHEATFIRESKHPKAMRAGLGVVSALATGMLLSPLTYFCIPMERDIMKWGFESAAEEHLGITLRSGPR